MAYNDLIKLFLDRINKEREGTKYEPLKFMAVKSKCAGIKKIEELQAFFADCEKARNFSEYFFYQLDPKKFKKVIHKTTK